DNIAEVLGPPYSMEPPSPLPRCLASALSMASSWLTVPSSSLYPPLLLLLSLSVAPVLCHQEPSLAVVRRGKCANHPSKAASAKTRASIGIMLWTHHFHRVPGGGRCPSARIELPSWAGCRN
ncbi:hypothetical protein Vretimale_9165, partial [Volvox reticuliferus]